MIQILIGLILLTYGFLLGFLTSHDKKEGFIKSILILILVETLLAIIFASLHIFTYPIFIIIHIIINIAVISFFIYRKNISITGIVLFVHPKNIDYYLVVLIIITLFQFWSVHYNYDGLITTETQNFIDVKNYQYDYPYYSDEWYSVALSKLMIEENQLPIKNPLDRQNPLFINFQLPFHSFNAALIQLFNIDPLQGYVPLSIVLNTLLIIIFYSYLRFRKFSKLISFFVALLITHITNGANLPGLWYYLPFNLGIILFISFLFFLAKNNASFVFFSALLSVIFYPPLLVLVVPLILIYSFHNKKILSKKNLYYLSAIGLVFGTIFLIAYFSLDNIKFFFGLIFDKLYYIGFQGDFISNLNPFYIISPIVLFSFIFSVKNSFIKEKYVFASIIIGSFFWILYFFLTFRIVIEHERIVLLTSFLVSLVSAYGLNNVLLWIKHRSKIALNLLIIGLLAYMLFYSINYTTLNKWDKLYAYDKDDHSKTFLPHAPANGYLQEDEVNFFSNIKNKLIYSTIWKSTTISVATENYVAISKKGTISIRKPFFQPDIFIRGNCNEIREFLLPVESRLNYEGYNISIVHLYFPSKFECEFLTETFVSEEGFILYNIGDLHSS